MNDQIPANNEKKSSIYSQTLGIAIEFGFIIALPLAGVTLLGKWLSTRYDQPLYLYASILVAIILSTSILLIRIRKIYKELIKK